MPKSLSLIQKLVRSWLYNEMITEDIAKRIDEAVLQQ